MNNVYRDVQSVVARVSAKGVDASRPPARLRRALLLNCHFDTVPDSPGQFPLLFPLSLFFTVTFKLRYSAGEGCPSCLL